MKINPGNQPALGNAASKSAPYGYRWQDGKLVPDEREAPIRKLMYELFLAHRRKKTVARLLNEAGYRTRSGALFSDTAVDRMLRDPSAKGVFQITQNGKIIETRIEPIVSVELWEAVNTILSGNQKLGKKTVQLFAGLIYCGVCSSGKGRRVKMGVPSNSPKYVCPECRHKIGTADLEEIFRARLREFPLDVFQEIDGGQLSSISDSETLADLWEELAGEEKRAIVEQLLNRIVVGKREILIEFALSPAPVPFKTAAFGQQHDNLAQGQQTNESETHFAQNSFPRHQVQPPFTSSKETNSNPYLPNLNEPLMNESQAARFLGISRMTLLRKRNAGEIKFFRVGFRVLYSKEKHLMPFLENCEKESSQE